MAVKFTNNAASELASSINSAVTSLTIDGADEAKFPTITVVGDWFPITLTDDGGNTEVMKVTARTGASLTVVRGQEGTTAKSFAAGSIVGHRLTAAALNQIYADSRDAGALTGTLAAGRLSGDYVFASLKLTVDLTVQGSNPTIKLLDSTPGQYSAQLRQNSNNLYLESSLNDIDFSTIYRFELDTKRGYIDNSRIWTDAYATASVITTILGYIPVAPTRSITAGNGLTGGGNFSANRTMSLGTPGAIANTMSTSGILGAETHTHPLGFVAAEVSAATSASATSFPLGHPIMVVKTGATIARNAIIAPALCTTDDYTYRVVGQAGAGTPLAGVWRNHGWAGTNIYGAVRRA